MQRRMVFRKIIKNILLIIVQLFIKYTPFWYRYDQLNVEIFILGFLRLLSFLFGRKIAPQPLPVLPDSLTNKVTIKLLTSKRGPSETTKSGDAAVKSARFESPQRGEHADTTHIPIPLLNRPVETPPPHPTPPSLRHHNCIYYACQSCSQRFGDRLETLESVVCFGDDVQGFETLLWFSMGPFHVTGRRRRSDQCNSGDVIIGTRAYVSCQRGV